MPHGILAQYFLFISCKSVQLQNTYRIGPNPSERFQSKKAEEVIKSVLESYLGGEKYSSNISSSLVQQISDVIKGRMKDLGFR